MYLYHGTSEKAAEAIARHGARPRGEGASRWEAASKADSVYLTEVYALHFAGHATDRDGGRMAIVEIDADRVDRDSLFADEDALALAWGKGHVDAGPDLNAVLKRMSLPERAAWFASTLDDWSRDGADWEWSLRVLGNCTHRGPIGTEAVTRITLLDRKDAWWLRWHDPVISPENHRLLGGYHRATNLVFAGRKDEAAGIDTGLYPVDLEELEADVAARRTVLMPDRQEPAATATVP